MGNDAVDSAAGGPWFRVDRRMLGVMGRFALYFVALDAAIFWLMGHTGAVRWLEEATAITTAGLSTWSGVTAHTAGASVVLPNRVLLIGADCTGVFLAAMLVSLVLAYPVKGSTRFVGVVAGVAMLLVANLAGSSPSRTCRSPLLRCSRSPTTSSSR